MTTKRDGASDLRAAAEKQHQAMLASPLAGVADIDLRRLVQELQIHQIELEMQNEELLQARAEREAALASYTELYDFAPVGYVTLDRRCIIQQLNLAGARLLVADGPRPIGRHFADFVALDSRPVLAGLLDRAFAGHGREACDIELVSENPSCRRPFVHVEAELSGGGTVHAVVMDITARRDAELTMQTSRTDAERANNAKSRFLAAASHDLRQPLSALAIYTAMLKDKLAPADQPLFTHIKDCIGSLSGLLNDLLDLSKLEARVVTPSVCDFPVADVLTSVESIHAPEARLKGLRLHCRPSQLIAHTDPVLFTRLLGNLIDNAIRYTEHGGVVVGCRRRLGKTWVEVWDTGSGIPEDKTSEIFEEFKQLGDQARTHGSGLGLAIVAKTADLLWLEISVRSRLGRGSVFAIELPLGQHRDAPLPAPGEAAHRPLRIALVEDNALVRQSFTLALQSAGHQVIAATTREELLKELGGQPPDIVISDYRLNHGETGFSVITAVRAAVDDGLPAILITGDTDSNLMRRMADRGIIVLHKPLGLEALQACLEDLTSKARLRDAAGPAATRP